QQRRAFGDVPLDARPQRGHEQFQARLARRAEEGGRRSLEGGADQALAAGRLYVYAEQMRKPVSGEFGSVGGRGPQRGVYLLLEVRRPRTNLPRVVAPEAGGRVGGAEQIREGRAALPQAFAFIL